MGASNRIQDTNLDITKFQCSQCEQSFTEKDKETDNWDLWWDTGKDVEFKEFSRKWDWLKLIIYVRDITHKLHGGTVNGKEWRSFDCPEKIKDHE